MNTWAKTFILCLVIIYPLFLSAEQSKNQPTLIWKKIALLTGTTVIGITAIILVSYGIYKKMSNEKSLENINAVLQSQGIPPTRNARRFTLSSQTLSTTSAAYSGNYELLETLIKEANVEIEDKALEYAVAFYNKNRDLNKTQEQGNYYKVIEIILKKLSENKASTPARLVTAYTDLQTLFKQYGYGDSVIIQSPLQKINNKLQATGLQPINNLGQLNAELSHSITYLDNAFTYKDYELIQDLCEASAYNMIKYTFIDVVQSYLQYRAPVAHPEKADKEIDAYLTLIETLIKNNHVQKLPDTIFQQAQKNKPLLILFEEYKVI